MDQFPKLIRRGLAMYRGDSSGFHESDEGYLLPSSLRGLRGELVRDHN